MAAKAESRKQKEVGGNFVKKNISLKLMNKKEDSPSASPLPTEPAEVVTEEGTSETTTIVPEPTPTTAIDQNPRPAVDQTPKQPTEDLGSVPINIVGKAVLAPPITICSQCDKPILIYGRMKKCKHCFCRECAKKGGGTCPRCKESRQEFEEAVSGNLFICTHGGSRYDNKGCGNSYRSKRDLDAHIQFRHAPKGVAGQMRAIPTSTATTVTSMPQFQMNPPGLQMSMTTAAMVPPQLTQQGLQTQPMNWPNPM